MSSGTCHVDSPEPCVVRAHVRPGSAREQLVSLRKIAVTRAARINDPLPAARRRGEVDGSGEVALVLGEDWIPRLVAAVPRHALRVLHVRGVHSQAQVLRLQGGLQICLKEGARAAGLYPKVEAHWRQRRIVNRCGD